MRRRVDGHQGLENEVREEETVGDFTLALSYLKKDNTTAYFVVHAWSGTWDPSPKLQRSKVRSKQDNSFLDRLGFEYSETCNVLSQGKCHYKILDEVDRQPAGGVGIGVSDANRRFRALVDNFQEIDEAMREVDRMLQDAGFELPWDNLDQAPLGGSDAEAVYAGNQVWDFYTDLKDRMAEATDEVFIVDAYVDEELFELYVDRIDDGVDVRILTKNPKGPFESVAEKYAQQRGGDFEVRMHPDCHDRLVFVDRSCSVLGQSIKDAARKPTYMVDIESFDEFKDNFEELWDDGEVLLA